MHFKQLLSSFQTIIRVIFNREEVKKEEVKGGCLTCSFTQFYSHKSDSNLHKFCYPEIILSPFFQYVVCHLSLMKEQLQILQRIQLSYKFCKHNLKFVLPGLIGDVEPLRTTTVLPFPPFTGEPRRLPGDSGLPVQQSKQI